jgi:hypothetical protein
MINVGECFLFSKKVPSVMGPATIHEYDPMDSNQSEELNERGGYVPY